jgi:hypothetical protein
VEGDLAEYCDGEDPWAGTKPSLSLSVPRTLKEAWPNLLRLGAHVLVRR